MFLHHFRQFFRAYAVVFLAVDGEVGSVGAINVCQMIFGSKFFQVIDYLLFHVYLYFS